MKFTYYLEMLNLSYYFFFFKIIISNTFFFFFSSRRRHTRCYRDWSSRRVLFRSDEVVDRLPRDEGRAERAVDDDPLQEEAVLDIDRLVEPESLDRVSHARRLRLLPTADEPFRRVRRDEEEDERDDGDPDEEHHRPEDPPDHVLEHLIPLCDSVLHDVEQRICHERDRLERARRDQLLVPPLERQRVEHAVQLPRMGDVELCVQQELAEPRARKAGALDQPLHGRSLRMVGL